MTGPELEKDDYDVVVIGTGLAESIAAAALAKVGKSVLHLDSNEYYGSDQASLTLDELILWSDSHSTELDTEINPESSTSRSRSLAPIRPAYPRYSKCSTSGLPESLEKDRRRYALSLFPAILPSRGELISTLIDSDVSKYVSFRILDGVSVVESSNQPVEETTDNQPEKGEGREVVIRRVPGSKEQVFKDKSVTLLEKRRLMKFLMFAAGDFESDDLFKDQAQTPLLTLLSTTFTLPPHLSNSIAYAISHISHPSEPSLPALRRTQRYLLSAGRYGPSPFLVGQYGGAGEVAQGFCRACAVYGGTYVLGEAAVGKVEMVAETETGTKREGGSVRAIESTETKPSRPVVLQLPCHPRPVRASHVVSSPYRLPPSVSSHGGTIPESQIVATAHCIAITTTMPRALHRPRPDSASGDSGEETEDVSDDDTAVIVFPPAGGRGVVRALVMGEGTGSCPSGQYIIYLSSSTESSVDPSTLLKPFLHRLSPDPVFDAYYLSERVVVATESTETRATETTEDGSDQSGIGSGGNGPVVLLQPYAGENLLTEGLDWEAEQGRKAFWAVMGEEGKEEGKGFFEKTEEQEVEDE